MKILLTCDVCWDASKEEEPALEPFLVELTDDRAHVAKCPAGHMIGAALQNPKFELLFDAGALAICDGYHREAVVDFASAHEEFNRFMVRVVCRHYNVSEEVMKVADKDFKRSEPRTGAACLAYLLVVGAKYDGADDKRRNFRNEVVHEGRIPTRDDVLGYAEYVFNSIRGARVHLRERCAEAYDREDLQYLVDASKAAYAKAPPTKTADGYLIGPGTHYISTMLAGKNAADRARSFAELFAAFERRNPWHIYQRQAAAFNASKASKSDGS